MANEYVIGVSPGKLLHIECSLSFYNGELSVQRVVHGVRNISEATIFCDLDVAKKVLEEIRGRHEQINIMPANRFEYLIGQSSFDPEQLHIYKVYVGREVK